MKSRIHMQVTMSGYVEFEYPDDVDKDAVWESHIVPAEKRVEDGNLDEFVMGSVTDLQVFDFEDMKEHKWVLEARHYTRGGLIEEYSCHVCGEEKTDVYTK